MIEDGVLFNLAAGMVSLVELILQGYCLGRLTRPFLERKAKVRLVSAVYCLTMLVLTAMNWRLGSTAAVIIAILAAFLVMCRMDQRNYEQKLFLAAVFFPVLACPCNNRHFV